MKFKVKFSIEIERSKALEKALAEFVSDDQSVIESSEDDEAVPFGFSSTTYLRAGDHP